MISRFGEDTCNASGNKLISFLHKVELVACNQCQNQSELWLDQKSVMDYVVMDE